MDLPQPVAPATRITLAGDFMRFRKSCFAFVAGRVAFCLAIMTGGLGGGAGDALEGALSKNDVPLLPLCLLSFAE